MTNARASVLLAAVSLSVLGVTACSGGGFSDDAHPDAAKTTDAGVARDGAGGRDAVREDGRTPHDAAREDARSSRDASPQDTGPSRDAAGGRDGGAPPPDASTAIAAEMNDVSILFPLPGTEEDIGDLLAPSAAARGGVLVPSDLYAATGRVTGSTLRVDGGNEQGFAAYSALRVVAVRVDPCFASLDPDPHGAGCTAQLRLIFQEITWQSDGMGGGEAVAFDSALHAFYDLSRADFLTLCRALVALRVANDDGEAHGALTAHPIIAKQGLSGAMSKGLEALVLSYAGQENLVRLAQFGAVNNELEALWGMSAFTVTGDAGVATPSPIATLVQGDAGGVLTEGFGARMQLDDDASVPTVGFGDTTATASDYSPLDEGKPLALSPSDRTAALDALVRVENPRDDSPNTIDCVRCHVAALTEALVARPLFSFDDTTGPFAFQPDGKSVTAADLVSSYPNDNEGQFNIHAFSYFGTSPGISQRVINETAAVVEYLNDLPAP